MVQWLSGLKFQTKSLLAAVAAFAALMATPYTHDLIFQIIGPHPRITALLTLIAGAYAVLHNPQAPIQPEAEGK